MAHRLAAVSLGLCALAASACTAHPSPHGDPDPGQTRLHALTAISQALPTNVITRSEHATPSQWDACDAISSTYGWGDMFVDVDFTTRTPAAALKTELTGGLARMGWKPAPPFGLASQNWSRSLPGGATATVVVGTNQTGRGQWYLHASAPPATHPVRGC